MATLAQMSAVDGDGAVWSIDPALGQFVRAFPGTPPVPASPESFMPAMLPVPPAGMPGGPQATSWGTPPALSGLPGGGYGGYDGTQDAFNSPKSSRGAGLLGKVTGVFSGRGRTLVLILVVALVLGGFLVVRSKGQSVPDASSSSVPAAGDPAAEQSPAGDPGATPSTVPSGEPADPSAPVPNPGQVKQIVSMLTSGQSKQLAPLLNGAADKAAFALSAAQVAGAASLGFSIAAAAPVAGGDGNVTLVLTASAGDRPVGAFTVLLAPRGKGWVLAAPIPAAAPAS